MSRTERAHSPVSVVSPSTFVMAAIPALTWLDILARRAWFAWGLLAVMLVFLWMQRSAISKGIGRTSLALGLVTCVLLPLLPAPVEALMKGIRIGALIASLLIAVNLLSRAVTRIPRALKVLEGLYRLPPQGRYLGLSVASQFFGGLLGLAGVALMMEAAARQEGFERADRISAFSAIGRGYSALSLWSPMYSNMSIVLALYAGASWMAVLQLALGITVLFILLGTVVDFVVTRGELVAARGPAMRVRVLMRLGWPVLLGMLLFLALIVASAWGLGVPIPVVIISVAPLTAWLINVGLHRNARRPLRMGTRQLAEDMTAFRSMSNEVLMFLASGCAGTVIGSAIPSAWTMALGQMVTGMPILACIAVSTAIVLLSSAAIHPMLSAVVVGSSLSPALLGLPLLVHLSALLVGWGLAIIVTPFSVLSLMASRWSGIHVLTISLRANIAFVVLALVASGVLLGLMAKALAQG